MAATATAVSGALAIEGVSKHFGGLLALNDVKFDVREGEVLGLIGPNGAGKTTMINVISGTYKPDTGRVSFHGEDVTGLPTHAVTLKGLVRTFQIAAFFPNLTVREHMLITATQSQQPSISGIFFNSIRGRSIQKVAKQRAEELLEVMSLTQYANSVPRELPTGFQRWLGMAMALSLSPKLLLLDEPFCGLNAGEIDHTLGLLKQFQKERGLSILLVEHNMRAVMGFCDRIVVLNFGTKICEGTPAEVRKDPAVVDAYLGGEDGAAA